MTKQKAAEVITRPSIVGRRLAPEERKQQILQTAIDLIVESGFGFTMREIAQALGVAHSLVFRYFESKEDLIDAVYEHVFAHRFPEEQRQFIHRSDVPAIEKWSRFYEAYVPKIYDRVWTRLFISSAIQNQVISRRYLERAIQPIVEKLTDDTLSFALGSVAAPPRIRAVCCELSWELHASFFYTGVRRWVYETAAPEDLLPFIRPKVEAHFRSAVHVFKNMQK